MSKNVENIVNMLTLMDVLLDLLHGENFASQEDIDEYKRLIQDAGYDVEELTNKSIIKAFQQLCKDFSDINLDDYWDGDVLNESNTDNREET